MSAPSLDVLLTIGETEARVVSLDGAEPGEIFVTVVFPLEDSTVSLTFDADRFFAFVEQLRRFTETMPGKPS